jgi:hypothetical protein
VRLTTTPRRGRGVGERKGIKSKVHDIKYPAWPGWAASAQEIDLRSSPLRQQ